jgi:hypothetical protein
MRRSEEFSRHRGCLHRDRLGLGGSAARVKACGEIRERGSGVGVLVPKSPLEDLQRPSVKRFRLAVSLKPVEDRSQSGEIAGDVGMIGTERAFAERYCPPRERLTASAAPARVFDAAEVVVERSEREVPSAETRARDLEGPAIRSPARREAPLILVHHAEAIEQPHRESAVEPSGALGKHQRLREQAFGSIVPARRAFPVAEIRQPTGSDFEDETPHRQTPRGSGEANRPGADFDVSAPGGILSATRRGAGSDCGFQRASSHRFPEAAPAAPERARLRNPEVASWPILLSRPCTVGRLQVERPFGG